MLTLNTKTSAQHYVREQDSSFNFSFLKESTYTFFPPKSVFFSHRWTRTAKLTPSHLPPAGDQSGTELQVCTRRAGRHQAPCPSQQRELAPSPQPPWGLRLFSEEGRRPRLGKLPEALAREIGRSRVPQGQAAAPGATRPLASPRRGARPPARREDSPTGRPWPLSGLPVTHPGSFPAPFGSASR